ncbi:MAG TPA: glycosyltransferase [Acidimicrobiales bacterium]|nr:glycosyltransferase [Acidimicrobiales bacterium]
MIDLSVLVPTFDRPGLLRSCLASLAAQDLPRGAFEVVVVDDGSGPAVAAEVATARTVIPDLVAVRLDTNAGPATARNRAADASSGTLLLFVDDDIVAPPDLVASHLRHHAGGDNHLAVLGRVDWHPDLMVTPFMRWLDRSGLQFAYETWLRDGPVEPPYAAFYTANLSMSRAMFEAGGGFDERFPYPAYEDMELAWRLTGMGLRLEYHEDALAYHRRAITLPEFCARMTRVGESATLLSGVQPGFPLDDSLPLAGRRGRKRRLALAVASRVVPNAAQRAAWRDERYGAAVAAAYLEGRTRAAVAAR